MAQEREQEGKKGGGKKKRGMCRWGGHEMRRGEGVG